MMTDFNDSHPKEVIPFRKDMMLAICEGRKRMTSRNSRYPLGTHMYCQHGWDLIIQVTDVKRMRLGNVAQQHFKDEGFDSPAAFIDVWNEIHPKKRYSAIQTVWVHTFCVLEAKRWKQ